MRGRNGNVPLHLCVQDGRQQQFADLPDHPARPLMFPRFIVAPAEPKSLHTAEATALNPPANEVGA
jgi:hypothetical protein